MSLQGTGWEIQDPLAAHWERNSSGKIAIYHKMATQREAKLPPAARVLVLQESSRVLGRAWGGRRSQACLPVSLARESHKVNGLPIRLPGRNESPPQAASGFPCTRRDGCRRGSPRNPFGGFPRMACDEPLENDGEGTEAVSQVGGKASIAARRFRRLEVILRRPPFLDDIREASTHKGQGPEC
jgi:hypothetical protein